MDLSHSFNMSMAATRTRQLLRRNLWTWPLMAVAVLGLVGWWVHSKIEATTKTQLATQLTTLLDADLAAMQLWLKSRQQTATAFAFDPTPRDDLLAQIALAQQSEYDVQTLQHSSQQAAIRAHFEPFMQFLGFHGFMIFDTERRVVAAQFDDPVGRPAMRQWQGMLDDALAGEATVTVPFPSAVMIPDKTGELAIAQPTMFVAAPIHDEDGKVIAILALRIRPEDAFTEILQLARSGESGETYAFDANGNMISNSRFTPQLKHLGLLPDRDDTEAIFNIRIRDPGVDMTEGNRPELTRDEQPLTRMAQSAINGERGFDVDGYRDYRGVSVIGAWAWLPEYGIGIATEVDRAEAYRPLYLLRTLFAVLFGLLTCSAIAAVALKLRSERLNLVARRATLKAKQLGQYHLEEQIGAGGMGIVYRGRHAMMQRPTAVKVLNVDQNNEVAIERFQREVQLCSQLTHPNTIAIYDFGRTPDGLFYYAMELLDGIALDQLVEAHGPLPESRVIAILLQACGSLGEAHAKGMIHRDVKPANIMLTRTGGMHDFVKVLDFGLVKAANTPTDTDLTMAGALTGTPKYLSPEGIDHPSEVTAQSDLYSLGAVGYFLLTGQPVFDGETAIEICLQHLQKPPVPPSERAGRPIDADLEALILQCLAKLSADRPTSALALADRLRACAASGLWDETAARQWWSDQVPPDRSNHLASPANHASPRVQIPITTHDADSIFDP